MKTGGRLAGDPSGNAQALSGPIVKDAGGNLLVLCARDLVEESAVLFQDGRRVGIRPSGFRPSITDQRDPISLVAWYSVDRGVTIAPDRAIFDGFVEDHEDIGGDIAVTAPDGDLPGRIVGIDAYVDFELPWSGGDVTIEGLIRISLRDSAADFPIGWSGGAVRTEAGRLVGIIVGELEGDALVAPISPILKAEGLMLASERDISRHNADVLHPSLASDAPGLMDVVQTVQVGRGSVGSDPMRTIVDRWLRLTSASTEIVSASGPDPHEIFMIDVSQADALTQQFFVYLGVIADDSEADLMERAAEEIQSIMESKAKYFPDLPRSSFRRVMDG